MDKQREMFEAWYSKHCEPGVGPWFVRDKDNSDEYHMSHTQTAWDAWQAAIAAQYKAQQGWRLVPVEPTEDMLWALYGVFVGQLCELEYKRYRNMLSVTPEPTK